MVWYNPFSWGKEETPAPPPPPPSPLAGDMPTSPPAYGGRHKGRKHRKTYRGGKKSRSKTGRRKH